MARDEELDSEAVAITKISSALNTLDAEAQRRVVRYVLERFRIEAPSTLPRSNPPGGAAHSQSGPAEFEDIAALMEQADPDSGLQRVLVCGYWFQICQGQQSFSGQAVNDELKAMGHPSSNITSDMTKLKSRKPSLIQQVAKSGKAQQARKEYRLTTAGVTLVKKMISGDKESHGEE